MCCVVVVNKTKKKKKEEYEEKEKREEGKKKGGGRGGLGLRVWVDNMDTNRVYIELRIGYVVEKDDGRSVGMLLVVRRMLEEC